MLRRRMVGAAESILGILILNWAFRYGVYDESSLGTVYLLWGTLAAIFCLLIPGVLLVVRPTRWGCQVLPALLGLFVGGTLLLGMLAR